MGTETVLERLRGAGLAVSPETLKQDVLKGFLPPSAVPSRGGGHRGRVWPAWVVGRAEALYRLRRYGVTGPTAKVLLNLYDGWGRAEVQALAVTGAERIRDANLGPVRKRAPSLAREQLRQAVTKIGGLPEDFGGMTEEDTAQVVFLGVLGKMEDRQNLSPPPFPSRHRDPGIDAFCRWCDGEESRWDRLSRVYPLWADMPRIVETASDAEWATAVAGVRREHPMIRMFPGLGLYDFLYCHFGGNIPWRGLKVGRQRISAAQLLAGSIFCAALCVIRGQNPAPVF